MSLKNKLTAYTDRLEQQGLLRVRRVSDLAHSQQIHFDSNDYLALTTDKYLQQAYQEAYSRYPVGSGSSMLFSGYHPNHQALEQAFAEFLNVDQCLLFSSGYAANLAVTALLGAVQALCIIDKGVHASVYDGLALSKVDYHRFAHNSLGDLASKLTQVSKQAVVMTEGIFSMSGQRADLAAIYSLCALNQTELLVDEAHSFGVLGQQGRGAVHAHGLTQKEVPLRVIPLGKAFAAQGAMVAGQKDWIQALVQAGRSMIYSTGISPALSYGLLKTLEVVKQAEEQRNQLKKLIQSFKEQVAASPLSWMDSDTPIQQLQLGCPHLALSYAQELQKRGISCSASRRPTVTLQSTGLRIILTCRHTPEHIQQLFEHLHHIYEHSY